MAPVDSDRNLLFGLLAVQNGLIHQGALVAAFAAWTGDKSRALADHLAELGHLDAPRRAIVEAIVDLHVQALGGDPSKSLTVLSIGQTIRDSLARAASPDLEATLGHVGSALGSTLVADDSDGAGSSFAGSGTSDPQRFRILRPHARGGLGAVFVALDSELHREVALKRILDDRADDPTSRCRFLVEAQITGGLEHPGIVPVYGMGSYDDGRPYYAMRFIRGDSLKDAIDRFHAASTARSQTGSENGDTRDAEPLAAGSTGSRDLELRKLLRRFLDVCNAIEYAHSRGVIHRDIKPANIILGKHGETLVVDWGLAKPIGRAGPATESGERLFTLSSAGASAETLPGSTMGTPSYMSPEQADGQLDRQGPWSDVYGLGATLYCLLTGKPPFEGGTVGAMLGAVRKGEFSKPRKLDPSIDKALEAVCLKAMALKPEDRYATPRTLADDIDHWLADEPVKAYAQQPVERLGRWLRRHRTWTYAAVTALAGISLVATIGIVVVDGARRREADVRKEAETNFITAQRAVDDYLTSVSENTLLKQQDSVDIRSLRQELLNNALAYYKTFVNQRGNDPRLRHRLANAYFRVGEITKEIGSLGDAIDAFHAAQAIWEPLVAAHPDDHEMQASLAGSYLAVGRLKNTVTMLDPDGAMKSLSRARSILEPLAAANPQVARYQASLADCYSELAISHARLEQPGPSLALLEKAKAIEKGLIDRYPDQRAYQKSLAEITNVIGYAHYKQGNDDQALKSFREVQRICSTVLDQVPVGSKPLWAMNLLALCHFNIGSIHEARREFDDALKSFEKSRDYRSALVDSHPSVTEYQVKLGSSCRQIAMMQHEAHQDGVALQSAQRSVDVLKALVRAHPDEASYHSELGLSWNYLGCLYDADRRDTEALAQFEQAVAEQQLAVDKANGVDAYRGYLANHLDNLGEQFVDLGRVAEGLALYRRAMPLHRAHSEAYPKVRAFDLEVLKSLIRLGTTERHDGDSTAARQTITDARFILDRRSAAAPGDTTLRILLGSVLDQEANVLFDQGLGEEAKQRLERALALLRPGSKYAAPENDSAEERQSWREVPYVWGIIPDAGEAGVEDRRWRSEALWDLARVLRALKLPAEAQKADGERVAMWKERPPSELVDLAFRLLERAIVIGYGKTTISDRARAVRELELEQAAEYVRLAISRGFNDLRKLRSHPDSAYLLSREDVKPLIMDMVFPDRPIGDQ